MPSGCSIPSSRWCWFIPSWVWCCGWPSRPAAGVSSRSSIRPRWARDHADLGKWLAGGVVGIVLIALVVVIATKKHASGVHRWGPTAGLAAAGADRHHCGLRGALAGTKADLPRCLRFHLLGWGDCPRAAARGVSSRRQSARAGLLAIAFLGRCRPDRPDAVFGGQPPEIHKHLHWRRWHIAMNCLAAVIFMAQGWTGTARSAGDSAQLAEAHDLQLRLRSTHLSHARACPLAGPSR